MKDKRVTEQDLKKFSRLEILRSILEIKDLTDEELKSSRDQFLSESSVSKENVDSKRSEYTNRSIMEEIKDSMSEVSLEDIERIFDIVKIEDEFLVRYDYDRKEYVEMTKDWLFSILTELGYTKPQKDAFWREFRSFDFIEKSIKVRDVQSSNVELSSEDILTPTVDEVIDNLTSNDLTKTQINQILLSLIVGHRLEDKVIVLSGHKTRKDLFIRVMKSITRNRVFETSLKKLAKDSFDKMISRAILISSSMTDKESAKILESIDSKLILIDESNFVGDKISAVNVRLSRSPIDNLEVKLATVSTKKFVENAEHEIDSQSDNLKKNRYVFQETEEDDRLLEFMKYLSEIALIGNETIPSAMLYALYLDYCRYKKTASEFQSQLQFSKAISESLLRYRYVLSEKTERMRAAIKSERLDSNLVEELLETNLHFKDLYESNRASKVFNLRFDLVESSIENVQSSIYCVTDARIHRITDRLIQSVKEGSTISVKADQLSLEIENMISDRVKDSTFQTSELMKYLAREIVTSGESALLETLRDASKIVSIELTANLRALLIQDNYLEADRLDQIERAFRYDELDRQLIDLLSNRRDTKAKKLLRTFETSVDRSKKQKIREKVISEVCKNVRIV